MSDSLLLQQAVYKRHAVGQRVIQNYAAYGRGDVLLVEVDCLGVCQVLIVIGGGHVQHLARIAQADGRECLDLLRFERHQDLFSVGKYAPFALAALLGLGQVIEAEHHVLCGHGDGVAGGRRKNVVRSEHQHAGFNLRLRRQRNVHGHLVAVKVGVERRANQWVNLDRLAFHQHRLKSLNAQAVKRRCAIQQHRVIFDDFFKDVPNHRLLHFHHFFRLLDGRALASLLQTVIDERLEQFERHLLRQPALVQLQLRPDHDDRTARVVNALAQKILSEAALLALERIGERLQRAVVGATQHAATAAVVEQGVHSFLQHALFVAHNYFRRVQIHQLLQPVVAVDDAAIQIVQIGSRKPSTIQRHQRAQLRWNHRQHIQNHPLRLVRALAERLHNFQALGILQLLLRGGLGLHPLAQLNAQLVNLHALEQFFDRFGAHHCLEARGAELLVEFAELRFVLDDLAFLHRRVAGIDHDVRLEVENALEIAQRDIEQVPDPRRQTLEEPHVRARRSQLNVAHALATHLAYRDLDAALVADHAAVLHALVLAAQTLPVGDRSKNAGAEEPIPLRLERAVVDGLRLGYFAMRPAANLLRRRQHDADSVEVGDGTR